MPRPGPRPYEYGRRAWHSDRHQPMRGSLIQEIFRVANEVHSPATRKNKEWQEKLPFVVLKAEEIMYSKANSEAEYIDLKTLRDRANNAIDTIIRKDETMESGDLLLPCIEAVLNLGCVPKKTSRSQRHSNPGGYLGSTIKDVITAPLKFRDDGDNNSRIGSSSHRLPPSTPPDHLSASQFASRRSAFIKPTSVNPGVPKAMFVNPDAPHQHEDSFTIANSNLPYICKHSLLPCQHRMPNPMDAYTCPTLGRVYPLYYSHNQPKTGAQLSYQIAQDLHCSMVTPMMPDVLSLDNVAAGHMQNIPGSRSTVDSLKQVLNFKETYENPPHICCDLSLRLGLPSPPSFGAEDAWNNEVVDVGSSSSCDESKFYDPSPKRTRA